MRETQHEFTVPLLGLRSKALCKNKSAQEMGNKMISSMKTLSRCREPKQTNVIMQNLLRQHTSRGQNPDVQCWAGQRAPHSY